MADLVIDAFYLIAQAFFGLGNGVQLGLKGVPLVLDLLHLRVLLINETLELVRGVRLGGIRNGGHLRGSRTGKQETENGK